MNRINLWAILEYSYDNEVNDLEEIIGQELPEDLEEAIQYCISNNFTNHIAYNLMLLKRDLENE